MIKINPKVRNIMEWGYCIIIAVVLALLFRYYVGTPTIVKQPSMYPTLKPEQRLFLNRWNRTTNGELQVGDIITFEAPSTTTVTASQIDYNNPVAMYKNEPTNWFSKFTYYFLEVGKDSYIKRVIAKEGDHLQIYDGDVYVNGKKLDEPYLQPNVETHLERGALYDDLVVPENCIFVMGDNRSESADSRAFGCVPIEKVESKVLFRFWPLNLFGEVN
ncbi:MAG: signal peptidase I [Lachnospiraceae bacterium]|jgi:signal peptidase I|nr:signal peptidase I [Lachnospiraceae bacterium]